MLAGLAGWLACCLADGRLELCNLVSDTQGQYLGSTGLAGLAGWLGWLGWLIWAGLAGLTGLSWAG